MTYEFDSAVPIPTVVERQGVNIDMLKAMKIGESKWWANSDAKKSTRFYRVAKKLGVPIVIRKVGASDPRGAGVRMWRVDPALAPPVVAVDPIAEAAAKAVAKAAVKPAAKQVAKTPAKAKAAPKNGNGHASGLVPAPAKKKVVVAAPKARKLVVGVPSTPSAKAAHAKA